MPQVPTFCMLGHERADVHAQRHHRKRPEGQHPDHGQPAARAAGHEVVEEQEARDEDHQQLRHDAEAVEEEMAGEVAAQAVRDRLAGRSSVPSSRSIASA